MRQGHHENADVRAAIYARYSSENQRPESIDDQIAACRVAARERGYSIVDEDIFADSAASGARRDRAGLLRMLAASESRAFEIVLVDDLSRLARDNFLMLSVLAELRFNGVRVISVADGVDSNDEEATLAIQIRGVFNELQLQDLRKKTLRGQIGQKKRGYSVGERTFGYRSKPVGVIRIDKRGRPRPDGYKMVIDPAEAAIVRRIFDDIADGKALTRLVKDLNAEQVPGPSGNTGGWSPSMLTRMLRNEKYRGRWTWNRTETRRDPLTGRRRKFMKPESEWIVHESESLRIVPQEVWEQVQTTRAEVRRLWFKKDGVGRFGKGQGSRVEYFPAELASGAMACGRCGRSMIKVSGKARGYYGCAGAAKRGCDNRRLVRKDVVERAMVNLVQTEMLARGAADRVEQKIGAALKKLSKKSAEQLRLKRIELVGERRKLNNLIRFIAMRGVSRTGGIGPTDFVSVREAIKAAEARVDKLEAEIAGVKSTQAPTIAPPPRTWIDARLNSLQELLERDTQHSALALRALMGRIVVNEMQDESGRKFVRADCKLKRFDLI